MIFNALAEIISVLIMQNLLRGHSKPKSAAKILTWNSARFDIATERETGDARPLSQAAKTA
jgi:hypothetical protein